MFKMTPMQAMSRVLALQRKLGEQPAKKPAKKPTQPQSEPPKTGPTANSTPNQESDPSRGRHRM